MILYHGSTLEILQPLIFKSEIGRDFGFAFYPTDIQVQAERWTDAASLSKRFPMSCRESCGTET